MSSSPPPSSSLLQLQRVEEFKEKIAEDRVPLSILREKENLTFVPPQNKIYNTLYDLISTEIFNHRPVLKVALTEEHFPGIKDQIEINEKGCYVVIKNGSELQLALIRLCRRDFGKTITTFFGFEVPVEKQLNVYKQELKEIGSWSMLGYSPKLFPMGFKDDFKFYLEFTNLIETNSFSLTAGFHLNKDPIEFDTTLGISNFQQMFQQVELKINNIQTKEVLIASGLDNKKNNNNNDDKEVIVDKKN